MLPQVDNIYALLAVVMALLTFLAVVNKLVEGWKAYLWTRRELNTRYIYGDKKVTRVQ